MPEIITIETPSLGDRSYIATDGSIAAVVDPQRDIDRVLAVADERGVRITHVLETHLHNDYVTGGLELARRTGAEYVVAATESVEFERRPVRDGDEILCGSFVLRAVHTPGHTPHHLSYVLVAGGRALAVFTGGSMLFGAVGRTDLIAEDETERLTRAQYRSVRRLAHELPDDAAVHPTHGFGSFCSSGPTSGDSESTIGRERSTNLALTVDDEDGFVARLLSGLGAYPRYYAQVGPINRAGPAPIDLSPATEVDAAELRRRIHAGQWVVDLRRRAAFAAAHVAGTVNFEGGDSFVTYLGWTLPWGQPVTLVADSPEEIAAAQRDLARIGIDRPAGSAAGGIERWGAGSELRSYGLARFEDLAGALGRPGVVVLDVRREDEWREGHIEESVNIPLHDLPARLAEVPAGTVWVHCASGYRSSVAASLLDRAGRDVVLIDDEWNPGAWKRQLPVVRAAA